MIRLNSNFENNSPTYLDGRESVKDLNELKAIDLAMIPTGFIVYVESENYRYKYLPTNTDNGTSGKWRKVLYEDNIEKIVDVPEHYELASVQDGTEGKIIVDNGTKTDENTQVELDVVNNKLLNTDTHNYVAGEYVKLVSEVFHEVITEEEIYLRKGQVPTTSGVTMKKEDFDTMWGTVNVIPYSAT